MAEHPLKESLRFRKNQLEGLCRAQVWAIKGPGFGYLLYLCFYLFEIWPSFTFEPAKALKFSTLGKYGLRNISMECLLFGTISGPCLDHVGSMFALASLL